MTEEKPKRKTPQKYNPAWKDSTRNQRQKDRRAALKAVAIAAGYESWDKLATAAMAGEYIELNKPAQS
jgi:hypothetical protein